MTDEVIAKRTRKPRTQPVTHTVKKTRHRKSGAAAEIDKQLADAMRERAIVSKEVSKLVGMQHRYQTLTMEINELLTMQGRMNGVVSSGTVPYSPMPPANGPTATFQIGAPLPPGVGSIPANPKPIGAVTENVGTEVASEAGFR